MKVTNTNTNKNLNLNLNSASKKEKIPRPMNCFMIYRRIKQSEIVAHCPGSNHRDLSKIIAKWWNEATEEEKAPYKELARHEKAKHALLYPDYKYAPEKQREQKTRKYTNRPKDRFTSRNEDNNRLMEILYQDRHILAKTDSMIATESPSLAPNSPSSVDWQSPPTPTSIKRSSSLSPSTGSSCASSITHHSPEYNYAMSLNQVYPTVSYSTMFPQDQLIHPFTQPLFQPVSQLTMDDASQFPQTLLFENCLDNNNLNFSFDTVPSMHMTMPLEYVAPTTNTITSSSQLLAPLNNYNFMNYF
ncbi:hypothetical protein EC973_004447 [Apophysomyces ossiformis]|uniref:HMG box domain-containing protein n=1 Tax=Apophysomyces ossiformis TaxID=679940 RepID=A0A8H7BZR1_9FUNG|nr:hypothetical protein EC973_004447 [Apophysomyces ossiformis]